MFACKSRAIMDAGRRHREARCARMRLTDMAELVSRSDEVIPEEA